MKQRQQCGFLMIEALVAILIFSLGVLGMVAMGSAAVSTQSDARYRTDAAALADEMAGIIAFSIDRGVAGLSPAANATTIAASVAAFAYQSNGAPTSCSFSAGGGAVNPLVQAWVANSVEGGARQLPRAQEQIVVSPLNEVQITLCWQGPNDLAPRRHTLVTFVN